MTPQRRTALVSVGAACALIGLKLSTGLASGSLGLVSEAVHSGTDLVAALLTFFAVGVAGRPADPGHPYGHGKAEHLAALAEAAVLVLVSLGVALFAVLRLTGQIETEVNAAWWVFAVVIAVIAIDLSRTAVSLRAARRYSSAALLSNALHFGSDLAGTLAVLGGLTAAALGWPQGDSVAALFVAVLVVDGGRQAHPPQHRRPHGSRSGGCDRSSAPGDSRARAGGSTSSPAPPPGGRTALRRRRHRRLSRRGCRARARRRRRTSRMRFGARSPRRTSSSTSSRRRPAKPRSASARR